MNEVCVFSIMLSNLVQKSLRASVLSRNTCIPVRVTVFHERVLRYIDGLPHNLDLGGGLKIKANHDQEHDRTSRQQSTIVLPDDPKDREDALNDALLDRLTEYAKTHTLEFRFLDESVNESAEEGRKKKGGGGGGGMRLRPMMMLLQLKAAALGAIALKFIALIAFKALLVAKIALTIAGIVALKKLVEQKHHSSTYEVVAHPHYEDHSHFDRSFNQDLAYKGYSGTRSIH
ncbi:uncharacterized protein isoform X2 [Leptinotarsa decemlineata]|uniref:uncharacterized protein isoform X2 n=1 Tax=Leptinotarsa decemlineata TaxID=7539 RepID=UPI003D309D80